MTPEARYQALVRKVTQRRGVTHITEGRGFGASGQLKVDRRIFAMLVRGELVLKLPAERVAELVAQGHGTHFDAGKGRPMREWLVLSRDSSKSWQPLAEEALDFVKEAE